MGCKAAQLVPREQDVRVSRCPDTALAAGISGFTTPHFAARTVLVTYRYVGLHKFAR